MIDLGGEYHNWEIGNLRTKKISSLLKRKRGGQWFLRGVRVKF
jgi:hypothetical protein